MIGTAILIISLLLIGLVVWAVFPRKPRSTSVVNSGIYRRHQRRIAPTQSSAHKQLVLMLHGDVSAADRLIQLVQRLNPAKDINWCIDKALTDLERDRRR